MNGLGFIIILGAAGALVFAALRMREADRLLADARETLDHAENTLVCAEEWCV